MWTTVEVRPFQWNRWSSLWKTQNCWVLYRFSNCGQVHRFWSYIKPTNPLETHQLNQGSNQCFTLEAPQHWVSGRWGSNRCYHRTHLEVESSFQRLLPKMCYECFLVKSYHIFKVFDSKDRWKIFRRYGSHQFEKSTNTEPYWTTTFKGPSKNNRVVTWLPPSDGDSGGDDGVEALGFCNRPASPLTYHPCVSDSPEKGNLVTWLPRIAKTLTKRLENLQVFNCQASKHQRVNWQIRQYAQPQIATVRTSPPKKKKNDIFDQPESSFFCHFHVQTFPNFPTNLELCLPFELSWPYHTGPDHP